jgi:signal transduction histidine kinase
MFILSVALPLIYVALIAYATWAGRRRSATPWLLLFLAVSAALAGLPAAVSQGLFLRLHPAISPARVSFALLLAGLGLIGALTIKFLELRRAWLWPAAAVGVAAGLLALDAALPGPSLGDAGWPGALAQPPLAAQIAAGAWLAGSLGMLGVSLRAWRRARLPLHANRGLLWLLALLPILAGEAALALGGPLAAFAGQAARLAGAAWAVYAVTSDWLVDVRGLLRSGAGNAVVVLFTAAVALLGIGLAQFALGLAQGEARLAVALGTALLLALAYHFSRGPIERLVNRSVLRADYDPGQVARDYSRRIATILDVDELALAAAEALRGSVEARRAALVLFTQHPDGIEAQAIPGIGPTPPDPANLALDNPALRALKDDARPILQYELDFSPQFRGAPAADSAWLRALEMDAFAPMRDGAALCGVLAAGPRASGDAYRRRELELLAALAEQTAIGLKNARLFTDLKRLNGEMQALNDSLRASNEKLAAIDAAKTDFISIASHELRTPLTQLRGYSEVLGAMNEAGSLKPETVAQVADSLGKACERLEQVLGQMLDVSQIDTAAMAFRFDSTCLAEILEAALAPLRAALHDRRLTVTLQGVDDAPRLLADARRLAPALGALLGNAVKYTPDGGQIEVTALPVAGEALEVVVADSGVGIDPKYHELIFEKFFRVGSAALHSTGSTKFMGAGPGLGLPLARGVVQGHGGRIWVESAGFNMQKLPGSRFHLWLPLRPPEMASGAPLRLDSAALRRDLQAEERRALAPASAPAPPPR